MPARVPADVLDPELYEHLGEIPESLLSEEVYWSVELVERYAREWAVALAHALGVPAGIAAGGEGGATAAELGERLGCVAGFRQPLAWLLEELEVLGEVHAAGTPTLGDGRRFRLAGSLRPALLAAVREATLAHDDSNAPFLDLLDLAGNAWPRVAAGEVQGERALLGPEHLSLWLRYFSNENPAYALNNRFAAVAAANRLPAGGVPGRVLEVGAGAGGATVALLEALEERGGVSRVASYRLTEPAALLRRRGAREIASRWPDLPLAAAGLDIDAAWADQGIEPGSVDLVFGVNVFHVADDLGRSLAEARAALAPGGWLVAGECLKPRPDHPVAAEMIFLLLDDFRAVHVDPEVRPAAGFLTPELWVAQLEAAGFSEVELVPDVRVLREYYPRFATGAVCGRA
jgi:SAM-dependent methyltransferase